VVWIVSLTGCFLFATAIGFAVGRWWITPLPFLVILAWLYAQPPNSADDIPSLAGLLLWAAQAGILVGVVARKLWRLQPLA